MSEAVPSIQPSGLLQGLGVTGRTPMPWWGLLVTSVALAATAGVGINIQNSCQDFGTSATERRVDGLKIYNVIVLILGIVMFIASFTPTFAYFYYLNRTRKTV